MLDPNEIEQIINLIHNGCSLKLLSSELDIPMEQILAFKKQLELRKFAKESIKKGQMQTAIEQLSSFVEMTETCFVEKMLLLKLKAYSNANSIDEDELRKIEEERKQAGFVRDIDEILDELQIQIPKRKNSNTRRKREQDAEEPQIEKVVPPINTIENKIGEESISRYEKTIARYKAQIEQFPQNSSNARNLLAFAYFKAGKIEEARDELMSLIEERGSYIAYRQLINLEKTQGNFEDAKLWGEDCLEHFPNSIDVRRQLISAAIDNKDTQEAIKHLRQIIKMRPENEKDKKILEAISEVEEK